MPPASEQPNPVPVSLPTAQPEKLSFMGRHLSLSTRPYDRKVYSKAVIMVWLLSLVWAIPLGIVTGIMQASGYVEMANIFTSVAFLAIYVFFAYFLYQVAVLRIEDAGDNKKLAWIVVVPYIGLLFALVYFFRSGKRNMVASS